MCDPFFLCLWFEKKQKNNKNKTKQNKTTNILQITRRQSYNPFKADVWSLGIMLFMMLFCKPPPKYETFLSTRMENIINCYCTNSKNEIDNSYMPSQSVISLLKRMICYESIRFNMEDVINHEYVKNAPSSM